MKFRIAHLFLSVKLSLVVLVLVINGYSEAYSQTFFKLNHYNTIYKGNVSPVVSQFCSSPINSRLSFADYFYVNGSKSGSWGQALIGLTYGINKNIRLGLLAGIQSNSPELGRVSPIILINKDRFSFFGGFEYGSKRVRWDAIALYKVGNFKVGAELIRYFKMYATGPRVEVSFIKKQPVSLFYSGMWDFVYGNPASMVGIHTTFGGK